MVNLAVDSVYNDSFWVFIRFYFIAINEAELYVSDLFRFIFTLVYDSKQQIIITGGPYMRNSLCIL